MIQRADAFARARLSDKRYGHTQRVAETAERLASLHGLDTYRTRLAALLHDAARETGAEEFLRISEEWDMPVGQPERESPMLLHGPVAAELARRDLGVEDEEVLKAIRVHTTGAPDMGPVALAVFVADAIEPGRNYPSVARLRDLAEEDLREVAAEALRRAIAHNEERSRETHPASQEALRWLEDSGY
ncbi:MAG: bis(5'-nucleosyl)-tetraphosphatase (symmetrical) YqeK [Rubrobacteraceae bacterium]|nr:bis(5'-nucleosyl)-tetraphosphatase (symmetrical) YqeK [Rubrobacter sp.]